MLIDPNELLIFKKRGLYASEELPGPEKEELLEAPKQQERAAAEARTLVKERIPPEATGQQREGEREVPPPKPLRINKSARGNVASAKGQVCSNHPWRDAYALCNYCKRPYCYADLVAHDKDFYCLEDIDRISLGEVRVGYKRNALTAIASTMLIINAALLAYLTYASMLTIANGFSSGLAASNVQPLQISTFLGDASKVISAANTLTATYPFQTLYLAIISLNVLAGLSVFVIVKRGFYFGVGVTLFTFFATIYAYLSTGISYMLVASTMAFGGLAILAYSRMSAITYEADEAVPSSYIDWPRPEVF